MKTLTVLITILTLNACGQDEDKCQERTEVSVLTLSAKAFGSAGPLVNATAALRDQCPNVSYQGIYALKLGSEPANCTDGDSKVSGAAASWSPSKYGVYYVRACATAGAYTSTGITQMVEIQQE